MNKHRWIVWSVPIFILLLNIVYKILFLGARDINIDEPFTLFYSQMPWQEIFRMLHGENNPPLYFLVMHAWIELFGIEPFQVRLLSLCFSAFSSVLIYFLGARNFSRSVGISAALLFTFSNFNTYLAQEARVYALFVFLALTSVYLFLKLIKEFKPKTLIFLIVINILLIYSHFFAFWLLLIEYIFVLLFPDIRKKLFKPFLIMTGILLVAFLPYLMIFINRFLASSGGTWLEPPTVSSIYNLLWKFCNQPVPTVIVIIILIIGLCKYVFLRFKGTISIDKATWFVLMWFILPTSIIFIISFSLPVFYEKYLVFLAPALYLLVSRAILFITKKDPIRLGLFIILISGFIITSTPRPYYSRSVTLLSNDLKSLRNNRDPVLITPGYYDKTLIYYYNRNWFKDHQNFDQLLQKHLFIPVYNPASTLSMEFVDKTQVFLVEAGSQYLDPTGIVLENLMLQFDSVEKVEYDNVVKLFILRKNGK
ncbi:MAG: glycosyltransferase family 39 protein [Bacteroidales bacterium]|nr:glycosyltransferase family 39 protein [Bacteroidales bacterium]